MDAPTAPYVAFVESDATDNDNWIGVHSGDPDEIDWSTYTEGTEAIVFEKVTGKTYNSSPGNLAQRRPGGNSYVERKGKRRYDFNISAILNTIAEVNLADGFAMLPRHNEVSSFKAYYLIDVLAANTHKTFVDEDGNKKSYMKCFIEPMSIRWNDSMSKQYNVTVRGVSIW